MGDQKLELPIGKLRKIKNGQKKAFISYGAIGQQVSRGIANLEYAHYDLVYLKPIDEEAIREIFDVFEEVITVEENSAAGGLGEKLASLKSKWNRPVTLRNLSLPDEFIEHGKKEQLLSQLNLDADSFNKL